MMIERKIFRISTSFLAYGLIWEITNIPSSLRGFLRLINRLVFSGLIAPKADIGSEERNCWSLAAKNSSQRRPIATFNFERQGNQLVHPIRHVTEQQAFQNGQAIAAKGLVALKRFAV